MERGCIYMLCKKCGVNNIPGAKVCANCGNPLEDEVLDTNQAIVNNSSSNSLSTATKNNNGKIIIIVVLLVIFVTAIGVGGYLIGNKLGESKCDNNCANNNSNNNNNPVINDSSNQDMDNNVGNEDEDEDEVLPLANSIKVQANGLTYEIPSKYRYIVKEDSLAITNKEGTWQIAFGTAPFNYATAKANLGTLLADFINTFGPGFKLSEKNVDGLSLIYGEVLYNNQYITTIISELNDSTSNLVAISSLTDDDSVISIATSILKTITVNRDIDTNSFIGLNSIKDVINKLNDQE